MKTKHTILLLLCMLFVVACEQLEVPIAEVEMESVNIQVGGTSATISFELETDATIQAVKACYSTKSDRSDEIEKAMSKSDDKYTITFSNLQRNTKYYIRYKVSNSYSSIYLKETDELMTEGELPALITAVVTQITETTAVAGGNVTDDGGSKVTERGIVYSTKQNPTISNIYNTIRPCGSGTGSFTYNITGLQPNTTYYLRAYATNAKGTAYGEEVSFTTTEQISATPEYVDLGLPSGIKWADRNVGADRPEDYGDYFAWGETEPKEIYSDQTYAFYTNNKLTKYCLQDFYGEVDNKSLLDLEDDVAHVLWGDDWRIPTKEERDELYEYCTWEWSSKNGVDGYLLTSKTNSNQIFLPLAGAKDGDWVNSAYGFYWTCTLNEDNSLNAYDINFQHNSILMNDDSRFNGRTIRPVYGERAVVIQLPTVTTAAITQITETTAVAGGNVTSDGGASVTERGVVYSTNQNPTISNIYNTIRPCGSGTGSFTYDITGLQPNTAYYVRAYATNEKGTAYGEQVSFTTKEEDNTPDVPANSFSISSTKQVYFSPGNLQYTQSTNTWSFAANQWDYIGTENVTGGSVTSDQFGDDKEGTALADKIDLFGWSTSSTNFGVSTSFDEADYSGSFVDWGTNQIGNDAPNTWRTLTKDEWDYLLNNRANASSLKGVAQVNGVNGLILLPDDWRCPSGITFKSGFHSSSGVDYCAAYQTFTTDQWSELEGAGAVFLPAAGSRNGSDVNSVQYYGGYWSATEGSSRGAYCLYFYSDGAYMYGYYCGYGLSVRLVKDL